MIFAKINGQSVRIRYDEVVSDSVEYLKVKFEYSDDWSGYTKTAVFTNETLDKSVAVVLEEGSSLYIDENTCLVPYEVIKAPEFRVSVFGIKGESLITASAGYVEVVESGYCEGDEPAAPSESEYQQIINIMNDTRSITQSVREDADNGVFKGAKGEKGDKGDTGNSGVYVGAGDMPHDCNVQIDITGDTIDMDSLATKQYVDEEIATFDFIKVVDALPESGLPNRIYLVPNADATENNLFDEYIWVNGAWEFITTKIVEVELVNYIKRQELADYIVEQGITTVDGVTWNWEKWASGKVVFYGIVLATYENSSVLGKKIFYPFNLNEVTIAIGTLHGSGGNSASALHRNLKIEPINLDSCSIFIHDPLGGYDETSVSKVSVEIKGKRE